jgi:hypothetical protein
MKLDQLKAAIITRLLGATNDFKTAIGDRFYYVENPNDDDDVIYPYGVYQIINGVRERDTATDYPEMIVQFTFYDDDLSSATVTDIGNKFFTRFDKCEASLTLSDYYVLEVFTLEPREMKTLSGNWQHSVDAQIKLQKK